MRILRFTAENFKRLAVVEITPAGNVVKITGKNGQGKTSILDGIYCLFAGAKAIPEVPIRKGQTRARLSADMGPYTVERLFVGDKSTVTITAKDGAKFSSAQTMLDALIGRLAFDPLAFTRLDAKKQADTMRELVGLNFADLDRKRQATFEQRTNVNRTVKDLTARGAALVVPDDAADEEIDPATLVTQLNDAQVTNRQNADVRASVQRMRDTMDEAQRRVTQLEMQLEEARAGLVKAGHDLADCQDSASHLADIDLAPLQAKITGLKAANDGARAKRQRREIGRELRNQQAVADNLTAEIDAIDLEKAQTLAAAKFPVPGLSFSEDGAITFNGLPFEQASGAEQLRVSMAMAIRMNPELRIIRITDGSLIDSDSMKVIEQMAAADDYQVWIEQVDETRKVGIVIEDGAVAAVNP